MAAAGKDAAEIKYISKIPLGLTGGIFLFRSKDSKKLLGTAVLTILLRRKPRFLFEHS